MLFILELVSDISVPKAVASLVASESFPLKYSKDLFLASSEITEEA